MRARITQKHNHLPPPSPVAMMMAVYEALRTELERAYEMDRERANAIALPLRLDGESSADLPDVSWVSQCGMDKLGFAEVMALEFPKQPAGYRSYRTEKKYGTGKLAVDEQGCTYSEYDPSQGHHKLYIAYYWERSGSHVYMTVGGNKQSLTATELESTQWASFVRQFVIDAWKMAHGEGVVATAKREHQELIDRQRLLNARLVRQ